MKIADVGKLKYGSKQFNVTADRTFPTGMATVGFDDDGVKAQKWPIVKDGILVGLQTNRETAHLAQRELQPRLHLRQPLAQLSVPAHAEHPARARPEGIADRR